MTKLKVGTRGSRLAVAQTRIVVGALRKANPSVDFELVTISTKRGCRQKTIIYNG